MEPMSLNAIKSKINLHYKFLKMIKKKNQTLQIEKEEADFNHETEWKHAGGHCLHHWS